MVFNPALQVGKNTFVHLENLFMIFHSTELQARIASIDLIDTVATVRLELDNWTGHRFTDLFTLPKVDGEWKIMNRVFHLHI